MTEREINIASKLMRLEATALFARIATTLETVACARHVSKSISSYSAWMRMDYMVAGIPVELYIEREVHSTWKYTLSVEGKEHANYLMQQLQPLREVGFELSDGNENLTRQMNFSLGLYGACQMHIVLRPISIAVLDAPDCLFAHLQQINRTVTIATIVDESDDVYGFDDGVIFGDWQTWK